MNIAGLLQNTRHGTDEIGITHKPCIAWAVNDRMSEEGIESQLSSFRQIGYGGVMILPWGGMPYEFMSDEWLTMVEHILDHSEKLGMEVWIWDDWLFPSGFAGGQLGQHDKYKARKLRLAIDVVLEDGDTFAAEFPARSVVAGVYEIDKYQNPCSLVKALSVKPGERFHYESTGRCRLMVVSWDYVSGMHNTVRSHSHFLTRDKKYSIYTTDDMDAFSADLLNSEVTERYLELIHERYWLRMSRHFGKTLKGFFFDEPAIPTMYPWTSGLEKEFLARKNYDILDYLVQVVAGYKIYDVPFDIGPEEVKTARADYIDVWSSLYAENFYSVMQKWCHDHNVLLIGHQSNDHSLETTMTNSGAFLKNIACPDMPGIDIACSQFNPDIFADSPRFAGSLASVSGKRWAMTESYAACGHGLDLDEMRYIAEHQLVRGVNKFILKLANYNPEKSYFYHPPELGEMNPIVKHYGHLLCSRIELLSRIVGQGRTCCKSCVFIPMNNFYRGDAGIAKVIDDLARGLTYAQKEFDYVWDADILAMRVIDGSAVSAGGQRYSHIIIPPNANIGEAVIRKLKDLAEDGCSIILCRPSDDGLLENGVCVNDIEEVPQLIEYGDSPLAFDSAGVPVSVLTRVSDDGVLVVLLLNESSGHQELHIRQKKDGWLYEIDLSTQQAYILEADTGDSGAELKFAPTESKVLVFSPQILDMPIARPTADTSSSLLLDSWTIRLPNEDSVHLHTDLPSWDKLGWADYSGFMRYTTEFHWDSDAGAILSLGKLCYAATVYVDETRVGDSVFAPYTLLLDNLKQGKHTLTIDVLNTPANAVCGTHQRFRELDEQGMFAGTYAPIYIPIDKKKLTSGLLGPVHLSPVQACLKSE